MSIFLIIVLWTRMHIFYSLNVGKKLELLNIKQLQKMTVENQGEWELFFKNGKLPIWNAKIEVLYRDLLGPIDESAQIIHSVVHWNGSFSIGKNEELLYKLPVKAIKRGKTRILTVRLYIPHLFGYGETVLRYHPHLKQEKLVYPELQKVTGYQTRNMFKPGDAASRQSIFEDQMLSVGTREYVSTDGFQQINWMATAKTQTLQTNVYQQVADQTCLFALTISIGSSKSILMESMIKQTAFLIHQAYREGIPFGLAINVRTKGPTPFYYIPPGLGEKHLLRALEMLSVLSNGDLVIQPEGMLMNLDQMDSIPPILIYIGDINVATGNWLSQKASQHHVWTILSQEEGGMASKWGKQVKKVRYR